MTIVYVSGLISLLLTLILGKPYIDFIKKFFSGQYILDLAPERHSEKAGTPTMGGTLIVDCSVIAMVLAFIMMEHISKVTMVAIITYALFALIGFIDDYQKNKQKENKGLSARAKILLQLTAAAFPAIYMCVEGATSVSLFGFAEFNLGILYPLFAIFIIVGASNAVNLTDGLDGLASGLSVFSFIAMGVIFAIQGQIELAIVAVTVAAACAGFLFYNHYPAKIFMGDTGSLALGGILGTLGVLGKLEFWLIPIALVFVLETLSVIAQVISFKTTGKRIFKMTPIHHHFELLGWSEVKVVRSFWVVGAIFCALSVYLLVF